MVKFISIFLLGLIGPIGLSQTISRDTTLMGSYFSVAVRSDDPEDAHAAITASFKLISEAEAAISSWLPNSFTSRINDSAGIHPVEVPQWYFNFVKRSGTITKGTGGAFDITFAALDNWIFDGSEIIIPDSSEIEEKLSLVGFDQIEFNKEELTIYLPKKGMKIGFGGIGKGLAADLVEENLRKTGFESGMVNAGGDLVLWGMPNDTGLWQIAIARPDGSREGLAYLGISGRAVVTSGNYEKFIDIDGKRYSHIIDPRTGWPVEGLKSVTVIYPKAELADAFATAIFVKGKEAGLKFAEGIQNLEVIIVDNDDQLWTTPGINLKFEEDEGNETILHLGD